MQCVTCRFFIKSIQSQPMSLQNHDSIILNFLYSEKKATIARLEQIEDLIALFETSHPPQQKNKQSAINWDATVLKLMATKTYWTSSEIVTALEEHMAIAKQTIKHQVSSVLYLNKNKKIKKAKIEGKYKYFLAK